MYEHIYSSTQLKTHLREIKEIADHDIVYITENGVVQYVFMSVEVFNRELERAERLGMWDAGLAISIEYSSREAARGENTSLGTNASYTQTFLRDVARAGLDLSQTPLAAAIEYVTDNPGIGLDITRAAQEIDFPPSVNLAARTVRKFYCAGHDIIYLHDREEGQVLLCGFIESLDSFGDSAA